MPDVSQRTARLGMNISSFGWIFFSSFFLMFTAVFTESGKLLKSKLFCVAIFIIPAVLFYKQWIDGSLIDCYVRQPYGWSYLFSKSILHNFFYIWYIMAMGTGFYMCAYYGRATKDLQKKKQAYLMVTCGVPSVILGTINSVVLQDLNIHAVPALSDLYAFIWIAAVAYAIGRYKFLVVSPEIAAEGILSAMADALILVDTAGNISIMNRAALNLTGYREGEVIGKPVRMFFERDEASGKAVSDDLLKRGSVQDYETTLLTRAGRCTPVVLSGSIIRDKIGDVKGTVVIAHDISRRKWTDKQLEGTYIRLKEAQAQLIQSEKMQAVGRMASGVAHEVKNPLATIMQAANYLEDKLTSEEEEVYEIIDMIKNNIRKADNIISALLDFSRLTRLELKNEDINRILEDALILTQYRIKLEGIEVSKQLGKDLPRVLVDARKMEQVFINLLLNAVQAMPSGGKLFLRSYVTALNTPGPHTGRRAGDFFRLEEKVLIVEIEDTGCGIPDENRDRLFEPFFTTKGPRKGAGLGLSVTHSIIDLHKGLIAVDSKEGKGTKVTITLKITE
jgi:PAS domain S-box-containing protein